MGDTIWKVSLKTMLVLELQNLAGRYCQLYNFFFLIPFPKGSISIPHGGWHFNEDL
jgi:hypothetical protein